MEFLDEIIVVKKEEVKKLHSDFTLSRFKDSEFFEKSCMDINKALSGDGAISIIAEIKKASPSKGIIKEDFNHLKIAEEYTNAGADAISVLTDQKFFMGHINFLNDIAQVKSVPLLRKDFIIDEYQVFEAKSNGADVILLIAEALSFQQIQELTHCAKEIGMETLLEFHSENQLDKINTFTNKIIGINNRDLKTFKVDIKTTECLSKKIPGEIILVSESGISTLDDIHFLKTTRTNAILVGEHLMRSKSITDSLKRLKEWCIYEN
ncbi:indole-3-glycerol phosphate synthase TrpC [bacterium BMS3Abin03]|nr:indole-3-glycerol phosphate synthase TrpC [bacterium BMS3Abin03]